MAEPEHEDLARLLAELTAKGYSAAQLKAVRIDWEAACQQGAHPQLAEAARAEGLGSRTSP